jgi:membrane-associated phospholipid phosphatase
MSLVILGTWLILVKLRPFVISPRCITHPSLCNAASVNLIDRFAMGGNSSLAEDLSTATQFVAGFFAFIMPWVFWLVRPPRTHRWLYALEDFLTVSQVLALNGVFTEFTRLVVQRPRPYVYENPAFYGKELQNYTSFVSGHTSFSTAVASALVVVLVYRHGSKKQISVTATLGGMLAIATGILRVFAGRHFVTDALAGCLCGLLSAILVSLTSCRYKQPQAEYCPTPLSTTPRE